MKKQIINILQEIRPEFDFSQEINFIDEGMLDSFDIVSLVTTLDEFYGISIDGMDIIPDNFATIDSIRNLLITKGVKE
jgi:acyl carrier protein